MNKIIETDLLSKEDILALKEVFNALVFKEARDIEFNENSILEISSLIQDDFISGFNEKHNKFREDILKSLESIVIVTEGVVEKNPDRELSSKFKKTEKCSTKNFLDVDEKIRDPKELLERTIANIAVNDGMYDKMSFTPKIMSMNDSVIGGLNCMGTNLLLGSFAKKLGLNVKLAATAEHPFLIVEIENNTFIVDGVFRKRNLPKANGAWRHFLNYSVYYPCEEEYDYGMAYVGNFDRLMFYEILENLQALKEFFGGNKKALLPGYGTNATELLSDHEVLIQKVDWRKFQKLWFREIHSYFLENRKEWEKEFWDHRKQRDVNHINDLWSGECLKILEKTTESCGLTKVELKNISEEISLFLKVELPFLMLIDHHKYIKSILMEQVPIPYTLEEKHRDFIEVLRLNLKVDENFRNSYSSAIAASLTTPCSFENMSKIKLIHINLKPWEYLEIFSEKLEEMLKGLSLSEENLTKLKQEFLVRIHQ